jgi:hypothetical protein
VARWPTAPNRRPPTVLSPGGAIEILVLPQLSAPTAPSILICTNSSQNSLQGWRPRRAKKPLLHTYLLTSIKGMVGIVGADKACAAAVFSSTPPQQRCWRCRRPSKVSLGKAGASLKWPRIPSQRCSPWDCASRLLQASRSPAGLTPQMRVGIRQGAEIHRWIHPLASRACAGPARYC